MMGYSEYENEQRSERKGKGKERTEVKDKSVMISYTGTSAGKLHIIAIGNKERSVKQRASGIKERRHGRII
jgi:hypothetical protein